MKTSFPPYLTERHKRAIHLREWGRCRFREIGEALGVSASRAREIYREGVSRRDGTPECFHGLTYRTIHVLKNLNLWDREAVLAAVGMLGAVPSPHPVTPRPAVIASRPIHT